MTLSGEALNSMQQVYAAADSLGLSASDTLRAKLIATMVVLDESGGHVYTDADEPAGEGSSRGIFQQLTGWGPVSVRENPYQSALLFFNGGAEGQSGLLDIPGWQTGTPWQVAEDVQQSATPGGTNYQGYYDQAVSILSQLGAGKFTPSPGGTPTPGSQKSGAVPASNNNPLQPSGNPLAGNSGSPPEGIPGWEKFLLGGVTTSNDPLQPKTPIGSATDAVTGIGDLIATSVKILTDLMMPSFWLRIIAGFGGIALLIIATYLIATSN